MLATKTTWSGYLWKKGWFLNIRKLLRSIISWDMFCLITCQSSRCHHDTEATSLKSVWFLHCNWFDGNMTQKRPVLEVSDSCIATALVALWHRRHPYEKCLVLALQLLWWQHDTESVTMRSSWFLHGNCIGGVMTQKRTVLRCVWCLHPRLFWWPHETEITDMRSLWWQYET